MFRAEPSHFEGLNIIDMVGLSLDFAAFLARLWRHPSSPDFGLDLPLGLQSVSMAEGIGGLISSASFEFFF